MMKVYVLETGDVSGVYMSPELAMGTLPNLEFIAQLNKDKNRVCSWSTYSGSAQIREYTIVEDGPTASPTKAAFYSKEAPTYHEIPYFEAEALVAS